MTSTEELSRIEEKACELLENHNGIYLEKRLYKKLKEEFPALSRKDFQTVMDEVLKHGYAKEHALIKPITDKEAKKDEQDFSKGKLSGKGHSEIPRIPNKRELE
ncbi:hypothetical protein [Methanobacterium congolense]|uniref:Uncharacterized protein n=1 Tax=Methanobacterium congolense TaxID=118062 RepID=A0A1D3L3U8_9EURY|nr:hypothetical protein [Methanobacterium congolense]SCG86246.1 putative protein [Methanobacterium congolense]